MLARKKNSTLVDAIRAAGTLVLATPLAAAAQSGQNIGEPDEVEEIVVTGSRLVRRDFSAPSPITSIDREAISFSGQTTLETALNKMPQVTPSFDRTSNNPGDGTATVDLRGLGSNRTLVMLNGRRLASAGIGSSVDINSLPQTLIERVEVITGGATTVYGSDAVAGVVNFITRNDFDGFGIDSSAYTTERNDATVYDVNLSYGHQFANGNLTVFGGYYDREPLFMSEREMSRFAWFDFDGELVAGGSSAVPEGAIFSPRIDFGDGQGPVRTIFEPDGNPRAFVIPDDLYNYAPVNYLQVPMKRYTGGILANFDLTNRTEGYIELTHTRSEVEANLAPVPIAAPMVVNLDNPVLTPTTQQLFADNLLPAGPNQVAAFFRRRMLESGARILNNVADYSRLTAGIRGEVFSDWDYDAWVIYNKADQGQDLLNAILFSRVQQGLLVDPATGQCFDPSNGCVPVDLFGLNRMSPEAVEFISAPALQNPLERTQKSFSAFLRGELFSTWAGPVQTAFGVEWRSDAGSFKADDLVFSGDVLGFSGDAPVNGKETVSEAYVEAIVPLAENQPLAKYLALEVGGRFSEYRHAGGVEAYKVGFEWMPHDSVRVRSMRQRSVRAPNLLEAFQEQFPGFVFSFVAADPSEDPCSASSDPLGTGRLEKCILQGIPGNQVGVWEATPGIPTTVTGGGNPNLTPEVATTLTFGVVLTPDALPDLQLSIDYFEMEVEDTIGALRPIVACFDTRNTSNLFCESIVRDPVTFDVIELLELQTNKGVLRTSGIDTQLNWSTELPDGLAIGDAGADLVVDIIYTHMLENTFQELSFGTEFDCAGRFGWPCNDAKSGTTYPSNRMTTNVNYHSGKTSIFLNWRWIEGTRNAESLGATILGDPEPFNLIDTIKRKNYFDLGIGYDFTDNIRAQLTVANLFDSGAAFMADAGIAGNTDPGMYDLFGRAYTLNFQLSY